MGAGKFWSNGRSSGDKKGVVTVTRCERDLKKLVSSINYNGRDKFKDED